MIRTCAQFYRIFIQPECEVAHTWPPFRSRLAPSRMPALHEARAGRGPAVLSGQPPGRCWAKPEKKEREMIELTKEERAELVRLHEVDRLSYHAIARRLRHANEAISAAARATGLRPLRHAPSPASLALLKAHSERLRGTSRNPTEPIVALREAGLTFSAIGTALGLTKGQVAGVLWRAGLCGGPLPHAPTMSEIVAALPEKVLRKIAKLRLQDKRGDAEEQLEALARISAAIDFPLFDWAVKTR